MPSIALVTSKGAPDQDLPLLANAVQGSGVGAVVVEWDDPGVEWGGFDLVVVRSTWDYTWRGAEFLRWLEQVAAVSVVANPVEVVRWNMDKRYLGELARAGVPVVETRFVGPGEEVELPREHEYVVKPAVSAGARLSARYQPAEREAALAHLARLHADGRTVLVQPFVRGIERTGERALVFCAGRFAHAIRKGSVLAPGVPFDAVKDAHPGAVPWVPSAAELRLAEAALAAVPGGRELLCARVDLVDGDGGGPVVMELELIEPRLFLTENQGSLPVFAEAIRRAAAAPR